MRHQRTSFLTSFSTTLGAAGLAFIGSGVTAATAHASATDQLSSSSMTRPGQSFGFDARCGLADDAEADIWKLGFRRGEPALVKQRHGCVIHGDHDSARYSCFCAHQEQPLVGDLEATKIPTLRSFSELDLIFVKDSLVELCQENFQAHCGPLPEPRLADCGTPTRNFCKVSMRGDLKDGGYNLFEESCFCEGKRRWESAQRLSVAIGSPGVSAEQRCEAQLERCSAGEAPRFDPVQMLDPMGYTDQELSCSTTTKGRTDLCRVKVEESGARVGYYCSCDGAERGGSVLATTELGAKSLYNRCLDFLEQCSEIKDSDDSGDDCDTSSSSDEDCEDADTSSADDDSDDTDFDDESGDTSSASDEDEVNPNEEPTETGTGGPDPESQPKPSDVLESLGCRATSGGSGSGALLGWGVIGLLGSGCFRRRR